MNRFNKLARQFLQKTSLDAPTLCFDLGSAHTRMTVDGKLVFFDKTSYIKRKDTSHVIALGASDTEVDKSQNLKLEVVYPIKYGKVSDVQKLSTFIHALLQKYVKKSKSLSIVMPTVYCNLPNNTSKVQKDALQKSLKQAGSGAIIFIPSSESIYNLISISNKNISKFFTIDIGYQTSSIDFLSSGSEFLERKIEWGADLFTDSIIDNVRSNHKVLICRSVAEKIKHEIALLPTKGHEKDQPLELTVMAKDLLSNLPTTITVQSDDFKEAFLEQMTELIEAFELVFDKLSPEQLESVSQHGIFLLGGGSQLNFMDDFLSERLGVPITTVKHPDTALIRGLELARRRYEISQ